MAQQGAAHQHSARFLKVVEDAKQRIRETTIDDVKARLDRRRSSFWLMSGKRANMPRIIFRGQFTWARASLSVTSRSVYPGLDTPLVLYCGGGYRSALAADNLQKMGYTNVLSMDGGIRSWREKQYPLTRGQDIRAGDSGIGERERTTRAYHLAVPR